MVRGEGSGSGRKEAREERGGGRARDDVTRLKKVPSSLQNGMDGAPPSSEEERRIYPAGGRPCFSGFLIGP